MWSFIMSMYRKMNTFNKFKTFFGTFAICLVSGLTQPSYAAFEPVNDDTDIFLANPNIPSQRPNVLIILDNTANWSRNVDGQSVNINEISAIQTVVNSLSDLFNVGLMMFPETGPGNNNVGNGAVVRSHIRQMTSTNKAVFANQIVGVLDGNADKSNNSALSLAMREAYLYFAGKANVASYGKVKTDFASNTGFPHPATTAGLSDFALPANPTASSVYNSPISAANICANNFIIFISNGDASENASSLAESESSLSSLGYDVSTPYALTPSGRQSNWADEWADFMANTDINGAAAGEPHVFTYVVEVDPQSTGNQDDHTALMVSTAAKGKGQYFSVTSANGGQSIVNALNSIFGEIQAVNSVFASTTLPVSVNVRGTNLNQVYIGVFRPDETKSPRWFGNLKAYKLGFDSVTSQLFLADSTGASAENATTGFINPAAVSHWTQASSFWGFRDAAVNGTGGASDSPDGDLVEKGGAAQMLRVDYAASQATRKLYTCTTGGSSSADDCVANSSLSDTPFASTNDDITAASLGLGTTIVSPLTGFVTQSIDSLNDSQVVTGLTTVTALPVAITGFVSDALSANINSITTGGARTMDAISNNPVSQNITAMARGGGASKNPVTATVPNHGYALNDSITISGFDSDTEYNGTFNISAVTTNTFQYTVTAGTPGNNPNVTNARASKTSAQVTVTLAGHGFLDTDTVAIAGVTPAGFNSATIDITTVPDADTFTFNTSAPLVALDTANGIGTVGTVTGPSTIATATTAAAHGYAINDPVTISGATISGYNSTFTITDVPTATTFTFNAGSSLSAEGAGAKAAVNKTGVGGQTVAASTAGNTLSIGDVVNITGAAELGYNGAHTVTSTNLATNGVTVVAGNFTFEPSDPLPTVAGGGTFTAGVNTNTATATVPGHGFATNDVVTIAGATPADYNLSPTITVVDADTFTYTVSNTPAPATGSITVRAGTAASNVTAIATKTAHGYGTNPGDTFTLTIAGATPAAYNVTDVTATRVDANTFTYPLATTTAQGEASGTMTSSIKTTTATATVTNHGLGDGSGASCGSNVVSGVAIAGANESVFNGTFDVLVTSSDTFIYPIPPALAPCVLDVNGDSPGTTTDDITFATSVLTSAQGDATGSITASFGTVTGSAVTELMNWVRGADSEEDENGDGALSDARTSIHGDVLHSRPAIVNFNRHGNDEDVYIFYGSNDGVFRAVKGGLGSSPSDGVSEPNPGEEAWGFIPPEHFSALARMRNNSPSISSSNKKPYFVDGSMGTYIEDVDGDGILGETGDKVWIFTSNHRGGRFIYALDVSDPSDPKYLWSRSNNDAGWAELGQTWSVPQVRTIAANSGNPVLIFGAGYDPDVDDLDPATITAVDENTGTVTASGAPNVRTQGRGIFVVDAATGAIVVQIGPPLSDPNIVTPGIHPYISVSEMLYAIPSDIAIITDRNGSVDNRMVVGDTGGNIWRVDMADASVSNWTVTKIAALSDFDSTDGNGNLDEARKFLFPPDVVYGDGTINNSVDFDAILIGSGDREHPFDEIIKNRFYMIKDQGIGTTAVISNLDEDDLFDATSNCIQDSSSCAGVVGEDEENSAIAAAALITEDGWFIKLGAGEKVVGNAVTLNSLTFFNTNQPSDSVDASACASDLGIARQYQVLYTNATVIADKNADGSTTAADRGVVKPGGGYLPSPVPVVVEIDGVIHEGVISGTSVDQPPGTTLGARLRKFWFKEIED
jgi:Tfp pilus tip-associated adhesin PilY1